MRVRDYLIGASLGNIVGGFVGLVILPVGAVTILLILLIVVSAYILYSTKKEELDERS